MEQVRMMRCGLCNTKSDMREMKYHKSGEYLLCRGCHEKQSPGARIVVEKHSSSSSSIRDVAEVGDNKAEQKVSYRCKNCSYSFTRNRDHRFDVCPYCGKNTVSVLHSGGAQNLLDESAYD